MPVTRAASVKRRAWLQAVLAGGGVHDEQRLVGRAGDQLLGGAAHLVELLHQVGLGVEAAGGVDDEDLGAARLGGGAGVVERGGGVAALLGLDDLDAGACGPDFELLDGGGAEGVGGAEQDGAVLGGEEAASLPEVVVLPVPLTPTIMMTSGGACGVGDWAGDAVEDGLQLGLEEVLEFDRRLRCRCGGRAGAGCSRTMAVVAAPMSAARRMGSSEMRVDFVDLAGERDDLADGLGEGLAGAGDGLPHAVEEAAFFGRRGVGGRGRRGGFGVGGFVALAEEVEGHA